MKLKQELIKLGLLLDGFFLSLLNLTLRVEADTNAEKDLEAEDDNNTNSISGELNTININVIAA